MYDDHIHNHRAIVLQTQRIDWAISRTSLAVPPLTLLKSILDLQVSIYLHMRQVIFLTVFHPTTELMPMSLLVDAVNIAVCDDLP